jgi:cell shape-determining protein MreC
MNRNARLTASLLSGPGVHLALAGAFCITLAALPTRWTGSAKQHVASLLRPAQEATLSLSSWCDSKTALWHDTSDNAERIRRLEQQLAAAQSRGRAAEAELLAAHTATSSGATPHVSARVADSLLITRTIEARVLGRQARAYLGRRDLLSAGSTNGIEPEALVVDEGPQQIDLGEDRDIEPGRLVLAGRRVWGKIVEVGPHTSTVRRITESGYRDLVQLASVSDGRLQFGPRGVLEGGVSEDKDNGKGLCRIRLIETVEPVTVGDRVYTAGREGMIRSPLLYGTVVRAEAAPRASHWEIWVQPAIEASRVERVAVLRTELNPQRVAEQPATVRR